MFDRKHHIFKMDWQWMTSDHYCNWEHWGQTCGNSSVLCKTQPIIHKRTGQ